MTDAELLECATTFYLSDDHWLERRGPSWIVRYERPGTMNPYYLNPTGEAWRYKRAFPFGDRASALLCLDDRGKRQSTEEDASK